MNPFKLPAPTEDIHVTLDAGEVRQVLLEALRGRWPGLVPTQIEQSPTTGATRVTFVRERPPTTRETR